MNLVETWKSIRDAAVVAIGGALGLLLPQVMDILLKTDFGQYTPYVVGVLVLISPFVNRLANGWRIK